MVTAQRLREPGVDPTVESKPVVERDARRERRKYEEGGGRDRDGERRAGDRLVLEYEIARAKDRLAEGWNGGAPAAGSRHTQPDPGADRAERRRGAEKEERIFEWRRSVLRRDEVLSCRESEREVARRDHERRDLMTIDGHVPVRVIGHFEHHRRVGCAARENVVPPRLRALVGDRRARAVGDRNGDVDRTRLAIGVSHELPARRGTAAKPGSSAFEPVRLTLGRLAPRDRRVLRIAAAGRAVQDVFRRRDHRHQTLSERHRGRRDDVRHVEETVLGRILIIEIEEEIRVQ